jgi:hypothetical protein
VLKRGLTVAVLFCVLVYGVVHLFLLRFETGDVYPQYSSLRADPVGAKAFYDALADLRQLTVRRNYRPIEKLRPSEPATVLYAGTSPYAFWRAEELHAVEALSKEGARIVITLLPVARGPTKIERERFAEQERQHTKERKEKKEDEAEEAPLLSFSEVAQRWGFSFQYLDGQATFRSSARLRDGPSQLEPEISWHSCLHFGVENSDWKTIYWSENEPAIIERAFAKGSLVLCADSYFLSNEALRKERRPQLLTWLIGPSRLIVFDEESHGVREESGVVSLVRKYRLQGLVAALVALAGLFVWKNAVPLVPSAEDPEASGGIVTGKHAEEGFVNLLRRSIEPSEIVQVCADEWKKSFDRDGRNAKSARVEHLVANEAAKPLRARDPVAVYRAICHELGKE